MVTCLNDYRPVALTSVIMKCFERLVMTHINTTIPDNAISITLHTALSHLDKRRNNYVRMLFIDYSSAFDTIVTSKHFMVGFLSGFHL